MRADTDVEACVFPSSVLGGWGALRETKNTPIKEPGIRVALMTKQLLIKNNKEKQKMNDTKLKKTDSPEYREAVDKLYSLFFEYRDAYAAEWIRLSDCEALYMGRHWDSIPETDRNEPRPVTPLIQSTVENIRAELSDFYPQAVVIAGEPDTVKTADMLTAVIRENHIACDYEGEYQKLLHDLLVGGYMVQETGFDPELNRGLGGAYIRHVDNASVMFDPLALRVEDCRAIFKFAKRPMAWFHEHYPKLAPLMSADEIMPIERRDINLTLPDVDCALLIECWFREYDRDRRRFRIHMLKTAGRVILEDSRDEYPDGIYSHGEYPFIVMPLFYRKDCCLGYGFADMFRSQQLFSDKLDQIVMKNALMAARNKLFVSSAAGFDIGELSDWSREVHCGDNINGVKWFSTPPLPGYIMSYISNMRESVKEESGANDFSRGATTGGVTAASAILALQEMSNKRARNIAHRIHGVFAQAVRQELELERQFSSYKRPVRMRLNDRAYENESFSNALLKGKKDIPLEFDVTVKVQRENRFSVISHNETILNLVQAGMLTPDVGLELLMFDGKEEALSLMRDAKKELGQKTQKEQSAE